MTEEDSTQEISMSEELKQGGPEKREEALSDFQDTRRGLLRGLLGSIAAFSLGGVIYGAYRFLAPGAGACAPVEIPLNDIPEGGAYPFQSGTVPCLLFKGEDGGLKAFSLVCSHLGCTVQWNPEKKTFYCPCHDGLFDAEGNVVSGPPPAPLERLKVEVKGDKAVVSAA
jgi:cytochrome b6-f complex iron-sulfur subunit